MKKFLSTVISIATVMSTCITPAFAVIIEHIDPETGEIISVTTEEDGQENMADAREEMEKELEAWIAEGKDFLNRTGYKRQTALKNAFLTGDRLSAESSGYIGDIQETETSTEIGKNAMFYLKDNVLVITGSGIVQGQSLEYPTGMFSLNENIESIIIGPGITWTGYIGANLPNLKAVIAMDVNTVLYGCFGNNGQYLPGYWEDCSMTQRVIYGAGLNFEEWTNKADYTYVLTTRTKPAYGGAPSVELKDIVMIAPNYNDPVRNANGFKHPDVILPDGLGYNELVAKAKELLAHGEYGQEFPKAMYDYLPVELGGTGKIKLEAGKFYLGDTNNMQDAVKISDWAKADVQKAEEMNVFEPSIGYNDKNQYGLEFDYTKNITRGQFAELMNTYLKAYLGKSDATSPLKGNSPSFADGSSDAVANMQAYGIMTGYNTAERNIDVYMGFDDYVTREQAATMLQRLFTVTNHTELWNSAPKQNPFTDTISSWAVEGVNACWTAGLISGYNDTTFGAKDNITIEQAIIIMLRAYGKTGVIVNN